MTILLGNGDGTFTAAPGAPNSLYSSPSGTVLGDFNHDGKLDLAVASNSYNITFLTGNGDGTFAQDSVKLQLDISFAPVVADFDGDGTPDLAVDTLQGLSVLLTRPTETATATATGVSAIGPAPHLVEANYPGDINYLSSASQSASIDVQVATPIISPGAGTYTSLQTVTISDSTPGATIYYSTNSFTEPSTFVLYTGPIPVVDQNQVIEAYASKNGYEQSATATAKITLNLPPPAPPVISLSAGVYATAQTLTISAATPSAVIYYTTNGSQPSLRSSLYTGPITVSSSETVVAIAALGYAISGPVSAQYIIRASPSALIYTIVGNGIGGYSGDGFAATLASLNGPTSSVVDSAGNLYVADSNNNVIREVAAGTGVISTIAGTGKAGYAGDNGPATSALLSYPMGLTADGAGNLYFSDSSNCVVRRIVLATGVIQTIAGDGTPGYGGDGSAAISAELFYPSGTAIDSAGNLYIADYSNNRIRKVQAKTGTISTVAGGGQVLTGGDGGPATSAQLNFPSGVVIDAVGNLYIADTLSNAVRKVNASTGIISTIAGVYPSNSAVFGGSYSGDEGPATSAQLSSPQAVTLDKSGNLYIADTYNQAIREVRASDGIISTVAGTGPFSGCTAFGGDGGAATSAALCNPQGVSVDGTGTLYIADSGFARIREVLPTALPPVAVTPSPVFSPSPGTYASSQTVSISDAVPGASIYLTTDGTPVTTVSSRYNGPIRASGNVTIQAIALAPGQLASSPVTAVYTITSPPAKVINTVAGTGVSGMAVSGGLATSGQLGFISAMTRDSTGDLFLTDTTNNVAWMISASTGSLSVVAGNGTSGYSGDGGPANSAQLSYPQGIAVDSAGNIYISDANNSVIREVIRSSGLIQTVAGVYGQAYGVAGNGDGGPALSANLARPSALVFDSAGNLYIADTYNQAVRMVATGTGIITTVVGNGSYDFSGEGGLATSASLGWPNTLAFDNAGNLYVGSYASGRICKVSKSTGILTTVAGNGINFGSSGDGGPALRAEIIPIAIALDPSGDIFIADRSGLIREVAASTGTISRVVGNGYPGFSGDGGSADAAQIQQTQGIVFDNSGNLYIADSGNYRVREVSTPSATATPVITPASGSYTGVQMATITSTAPHAKIYYTTDGSAPTNASTVYSGPVAISTSTTLQAVALAPGFAQSAVATASYTIDLPSAPTITATLSSNNVTTAQSLTLMVAVSGPSGNRVPSGTVTLSGSGYNANQSLASGAAAFQITAGVLPVGTDTLAITYAPDPADADYYTSASGWTTVTVTTAIGTEASTITLTPSAAAVTDVEGLQVAVSVEGASGQPTPTGSVTLAGGSFSHQQSIAAGAATFSIPAGALPDGPVSLTASYSGDLRYAASQSTTTVTVAAVLVGASSPAPVAPGSSTSSTATWSAGSTYSGTLNLTCTLLTSPAGAQSLPTCGLNPTSVSVVSGGTASTTLTVKTTASSSSSAYLRETRPSRKLWSGGGVLTLALLLVMPSWRRRKALLVALLFGITMTHVAGCGGSSSRSAPPTSIPATTAGSYTFSLTGEDASNAKITASTKVTITVQ